MRPHASGLLMILLVFVAALGPPGCAVAAPAPAETESATALLTSAAVVEAFKAESVRSKFAPADLSLIKTAVDQEILPALSGQKPISGAVARAAILAVDRVLESRGRPPLAGVTASAIEAVASMIQTVPLDQALSANQLAALRGFFTGLSTGLGEVIATYATPTPSPTASPPSSPAAPAVLRDLPSLRPKVQVCRSGPKSNLPALLGAEPRARPRRLDL